MSKNAKQAMKVTSQILTEAVQAAGLSLTVTVRSGLRTGGFSVASGFLAGQASSDAFNGKPLDNVEIAKECLLIDSDHTNRQIAGIVRAYVVLFEALRAEGSDPKAVETATGFQYKKTVGWILPRGPQALRKYIAAHCPDAGFSVTGSRAVGTRFVSDDTDPLLSAIAECRASWSTVLPDGVESGADFAKSRHASAEGKAAAAVKREADAAAREAAGIVTFSAHVCKALAEAVTAKCNAMDLDPTDPRDRGIALESIAGIKAEATEDDSVLKRADLLQKTGS